MKQIWIFDIDGTLAESGKQIDNQMVELLHKLKQKTQGQIGLCGGGTFDKIAWQSNAQTNPGLYNYIYGECGCDYREWEDLTQSYQVIQEKNIRVHPLYKEIQILIKHCLKYLSTLDYNLGGHMIDIRKGLVYVSLVGMTGTDKEREDFIKLDQTDGIRSKLLTELEKLIRTLGCQGKLCVMIGGAVGITIIPVENDKIQILNLIGSDFQINYFGDKYRLGGNDHLIMSNPQVKSYPVDSPTDTKKLILNIIGS